MVLEDAVVCLEIASIEREGVEAYSYLKMLVYVPEGAGVEGVVLRSVIT